MIINVYTAFSGDGGSTRFFIDLVNHLNKHGHTATLYGPEKWHLDKCNARQWTGSLEINQPDNIVIGHMLPEISRVNAKKKILSCHEMEMHDLKNFPHQDFDVIHFVSEHQKKYYNIDHPSIVIPPFVDAIQPVEGKEDVAGIIAHIHEHKQIHKAVEMALRDKMKKVLIYGGMGNLEYFKKSVWPLIDGQKVSYKGPFSDKQAIYDTFGVLYTASKSETYGLTVSEAMSANKKVVALPNSEFMNCERIFDNDELLNRWINLIEREER